MEFAAPQEYKEMTMSSVGGGGGLNASRRTSTRRKSSMIGSRTLAGSLKPLILAVLGTILLNSLMSEARRPTAEDRSPLIRFNRLPMPSSAILFNYGAMADNYFNYQDTPRSSPSSASSNFHDDNSRGYERRSKRRLVVRVPFAQNPDTTHLSRIYRQLFTQQKQKKVVEPFGYSIRHFIV